MTGVIQPASDRKSLSECGRITSDRSTKQNSLSADRKADLDVIVFLDRKSLHRDRLGGATMEKPSWPEGPGYDIFIILKILTPVGASKHTGKLFSHTRLLSQNQLLHGFR